MRRKMPNLKAFPHILQSFFSALKTGVLCTDLHRMMGFFLLDLQSLKQPFYLLKRDLFYFIRCPRPLELHVVQQLLGCQYKAVPVVSQYFYGISFFIAKDKNQVSLIWIKLKLCAD